MIDRDAEKLAAKWRKRAKLFRRDSKRAETATEGVSLRREAATLETVARELDDVRLGITKKGASHASPS